MARRSDIDWERIERLYVAGQLTIKEIAKECGVSDSQVRAKARGQGWLRDVSGAVKERTKAKIAAIDVSALVEQSAQESAQKSAALIRDAIEQASDVVAGVIVRHRADIRIQQERAQRLEAILDEKMGDAESIADAFKLAQTYKALIEAKSKLIDKEREAFNINESPTENDAPAVVVEFVDVQSDD